MEKHKIIAIDFDGTIVKDCYPHIGDLNPNAVCVINKLRRCGNYIVINTCRKGKKLLAAINFLLEAGVNFDRVNDNAPFMIEKYGNTRKIHADYFIDFNNVGSPTDWDEIFNLLQ